MASLRKEKAQCDRERSLLWDGGLQGGGGRLRGAGGPVPVRLETGSRNLEGTRFSQRLTIPSTCSRSLQLAGGDHRAAARPTGGCRSDLGGRRQPNGSSRHSERETDRRSLWRRAQRAEGQVRGAGEGGSHPLKEGAGLV